MFLIHFGINLTYANTWLLAFPVIFCALSAVLQLQHQVPDKILSLIHLL